MCYNIIRSNIGVSPSGKASDSDSDITGVRIPAPQPKNTAENDTFSAVFFYPLRKQWHIIAVRRISSP